MSEMVDSKFFGKVVRGSSLGKLDKVARDLEAKGYKIEQVGADFFTAFLEGKAVVEADVTMSLFPVVEKYSWDEYFA